MVLLSLGIGCTPRPSGGRAHPPSTAVAEHDGNLGMGVRAIARRSDTNDEAETALLVIKDNVRVVD